MARIQYDVDMVSQQFSPVCLLACAAIIIQFKRRITPTAETLGITGEDFRMPLTVPADVTEMDRLRALGFVVTSSAQAGTRTGEELVLWMLQNHGPFILAHHCGAFWYGPTRVVPTTGAHAVVITGIHTDSHTVYFNNPWGDRNVPTTSSSIAGAITRWEASGGLSIAYM